MESTPVERHGDIWLKRDDLYEVHGQHGGHARTCYALARDATVGLITAAAKASPQLAIVAGIAKGMGLRCRVHVPQYDVPSVEVQEARNIGAEVFQHFPGYNTVLARRAADDAAAMGAGWVHVPFGMECQTAVLETARQVVNLVDYPFERIVVPVGSGMSLAGILYGLVLTGKPVPPVVGVVVGANPAKRLDRYAPMWWQSLVELVPAGVPFARRVNRSVDGITMDPVYEAKCLDHTRSGDLLWCVGRRKFPNLSARRS